MASIHGVECANGRAAEGERRKIERHAAGSRGGGVQAPLGWRRRLQDAPAELRPAGQRVDPADRVVGLRMGFECGQKLVEVPDAAFAHAQGVRRHSLEAQRHALDQPGQPQASESRPPERAVIGAREAPAFATRQAQIEPLEMLAEAALDVVVLAVHVVGDTAAQGGKTGTGRYRRREAQRQEGVEQCAESDARLGDEQSRVSVEGKQTVQPRGDDGSAAAVQRNVAVASPRAECEQACLRSRRLSPTRSVAPGGRPGSVPCARGPSR